jgi:hypothetical protein
MAYEIPINTTSLDGVIKKFQEAGKAADEFYSRATGGGTGRLGGGASASRGGGSRGPTDPWARADAAAAGYLNSPNDPAAKLAHIRAMEAVTRANKKITDTVPTQESKMHDLFMTSRVGPGGQLYPLVNRLHAAGLTTGDVGKMSGAMTGAGVSPAVAAKMAPIAASIAKNAMPLLMAAGGIALGVGGAIAVGAAINGASNSFLDDVKAAGTIGYQTGSSPSDVARMRGIGAFTGRNPGDAADSLAGALHNGSYGASVMAGKGIYDLGSFQGDRGSNYMKAIQALRSLPREQAIRVARDIGMSDEMWTYDLNNKQMSELEGMYKPKTQADINQANSAKIAKTKADVAWDKASSAIGKVLTPLSEGFANAINPENWGLRPLHISPSKEKGSAKPSPVEKVPAATNETNRILKSGLETIGGNSVIPAGWKLQTMDSALAGQAMMLGAFGV